MTTNLEKRPRLRLKPEVAVRINWGGPDDPELAVCSICHGPLGETPLRMWAPDGSGAGLCDDCAEDAFEKVP